MRFRLGFSFARVEHDSRFVPMVDVEHPLQFIAVEYQPPTPLGSVHLVIAIPGEFDGGLAVPFAEPVVDLPLDVAELEVPRIFCVEPPKRL